MAVSFGCATAHAQYRPAVVDVNNEFGMAAQAFLQSYSETYNGTTPDKEHGVIPGVAVKATGMFDLYGVSNLYAGAHYQYDRGAVTYNGAFLNGTPLNASTNYTTTDVGLELGKGFLITDGILITPLVEGGWHAWERNLGRGQVENYSHDYVGAGVRGDLAVTARLVLTGKVGAGAIIDPGMTSVADPAAGLPRMSFNLGMRPYYEAGLGADYKFDIVFTMLHLYGGVDFTHFSYGASAANQYGFLEPDSASNQVLFQLGLAVGL
ncbi:MAG TPA: hypothetical protein VH020_16150 [Stellaceae bacterium]|jgi:hypothetical protein|nr:hypothetical protein [Stellaceae bacterium]